jgi:hypothetical protein
VIGVPVAVVGVGVAAHGGWVIHNGVKNIFNPPNVVNQNGGGGKGASTGQQIAAGHAGTKHGGDFAGQNMGGVIDGIIQNPSESKCLNNGRKAYWDSNSGTVVITDPSSPDGGTAFKPKNGKPYYNGLQ